MDETRIIKDINGFGYRVNQIEVNLGKNQVLIEKLEESVKEVKETYDTIQKSIKIIDDKMDGLFVKVAIISGMISVTGLVLMTFLTVYLTKHF